MRRTKNFGEEPKRRRLSDQVKRRATAAALPPSQEAGTTFVSTGSTLLDCAISGGRVRGGGIPVGILCEAFGPASSGKTVLLCEIAGRIQQMGGEVKFGDPEARLNVQFAKLFGLDVGKAGYHQPDTVTGAFAPLYEWAPKGKKANGYLTDSLAALSTNLEMENAEGDKMGQRRAKEFSEQLRKTCRLLPEKRILMVCSNQVRVNMDAGPYGVKYKAPGGEAIGFYSSLRLRFKTPQKIRVKRKIRGKDVSRTIGVETEVEVFKSSVWKPYRTAPLTVLYDYGIDDIRQNLQFIKDYSAGSVYTLGGEALDKSLEEAIRIVEEDGLEKELREETIDLWEEIERKFARADRKAKRG